MTPAPPGTMTKVAGLLGYPVQHSLSPQLHNAGFRNAGIDAAYHCFEVPPEHLGAALEGVSALGFLGVNLTTPHKRAAVPYLDHLAPSARVVGCVNTVVVNADKEAGREPRSIRQAHSYPMSSALVGYNTDAEGLARALLYESPLVGCGPTPLAGTRGVVIGAGGAARAAAEKVVLDLSRQPQFEGVELRAYRLAEDGFAAAAQGASVVVQATTLGMAGGPGMGQSPTKLSWLESLEGLAVDLVYRPAVTPFMQQAAQVGLKVLYGAGLKMLVEQASLAWELWTGQPTPIQAMFSAVSQGE